MKQSKAILYARFSPGNNQSGDSAEAQLSQCRAYAEFQKLEVIGVFKDEWLSGKNDDRPGFQDAIALTCKSKATMVVYSLSRFARSTKDAIAYAEQIGKAKANLASIKENLDTNTSVGRFFFTVMAAIAQLERETISERTRDAMKYYQSQGRIMSKRLPFGFERDPDNLKRGPDEHKMMIPCDREVKIIARMRSLRAEGLSYRAISKRLWLDGVIGRREFLFAKTKGKARGELIGCRIGIIAFKNIQTILKRVKG